MPESQGVLPHLLVSVLVRPVTPDHVRPRPKACVDLRLFGRATGGAPKTWTLLTHVKTHCPNVVFLQEVAWDTREWVAFSKAAARAGYTSFFSGTPNMARKGGAAVLIRKHLPSRPAWRFADDGGAAQLIWAGGYFLGSIYLAPNYEPAACDEISARLLALASQYAWLLGGDFNAEPQENPFCHSLDELGCNLFSPCSPTRWEGQRCIDYFVGNHSWSQPEVLEHKVADHKVVQLHGALQVPHVTAWKLAPVAKLPTLAQLNVAKDAWFQKVDQTWGKHVRPAPWTDDVTADWSDLSQRIFTTLLETVSDVSPEAAASIPAGLRRRGRPAAPRFIQENWNVRTLPVTMLPVKKSS